MSLCAKYHGFCDAFGAVKCGGDCAKCHDTRTANALTLGAWEAAYRRFAEETKAVRPVTVKVELCHLHTFMSRMKLSANDSMAKIDATMVQTFYGTNDDIRPVSRKGIIDALRKLTSTKFRTWAEGNDLVVAEMPTSKGLSGSYERYKQISDASMKKLRDLQWEYRQSNDPRKWLILTLALDYGMSKADILRAKWSDLFADENGVTVVSYCRNKTGKRATWKVSDDHIRDFRRAERLARELKSRGVRNGTQDSVLRVGEYDRNGLARNLVWNMVNEDLRKAIPEWKDSHKALHSCRKEFATFICRKYGWEVAEIATGDSVKVLQRSYVGKLVIDWRTI